MLSCEPPWVSWQTEKIHHNLSGSLMLNSDRSMGKISTEIMDLAKTEGVKFN